VRLDHYTIDAKPEQPQTAAMMRGPMLQALLADRFKLKIRRDIKDVPVYALVLAKGGSKLEATKKESCTPIESIDPIALPGPGQPPPCGTFRPDKNGGVETFGQTLSGLCRQFSAALDRDVVDRTGIPGLFDMHLALSYDDLFPFARADAEPGASDGTPSPMPSDPLGAALSALQKLGLKLEPAKAPGEFIAIDRLERPSQN